MASNFYSMTRWNERRGVSDDLCYLHQAYLFKNFGFSGIRTNIARDEARHFDRLVNEVGQPAWHTADTAICHVHMAKTDQRVLQYPPGVGGALALFSEGYQVVPMYMVATLMVLLISVVAIALARTQGAIIAATAFGSMALYFMINPAKASYSIAPTLMICAIAGYLTATSFNLRTNRQKWLVIASIGLMLGLSVNFRIANLLLLAGYGLFFLAAFLLNRTVETFVEGALFGATGLIGMVPTLIANNVNAGSPFTTTYGGPDVAPPDLTFRVLPAYLADLQGALIVGAIAWVTAIFLLPVPDGYGRRQRSSRSISQSTSAIS